MTPQQKADAAFAAVETSMRNTYFALALGNTDIYRHQLMLVDAVEEYDLNQAVFLLGQIVSELDDHTTATRIFTTSYNRYIVLAGQLGHAVPPDIANMEPSQPGMAI